MVAEVMPLAVLILCAGSCALGFLLGQIHGQDRERVKQRAERSLRDAPINLDEAVENDRLLKQFVDLDRQAKQRECEHRPDDHPWAYAYRNPPCIHCGMEVEKARWMTCPRCGHQEYYPRGVVPKCAVCFPTEQSAIERVISESQKPDRVD